MIKTGMIMDVLFADLIEAYLTDSLAPEQEEKFLAMLEHSENRAILEKVIEERAENKSLTGTEDTLRKSEGLARLQKRMQQLENDTSYTTPAVSRIHLLRTAWFRYAAAILLILGTGAYLWNTQKKSQLATLKQIPVQNDVLPGSDRAILTLSNGRKVELRPDETQTITDGELAINNNNGTLTYRKTDVVVFNTMTTPKGGQYKLTLPDGTKVWLNAASSITYPTAFAGNKRNVNITGEAYFEVAKNTAQPFIVSANTQTVTVLGTNFNISAYADENATTTTLIDGAVKVSKNDDALILQPGQQAIVTEKIAINKNADIDQVMAWKNGKFQFGQRTEITSIMRQLARWYDLDVRYEGDVNVYIGGSISRQVNVSQVLNLLQATGLVQFKIEGKKITVLKNN